MERTKKIVSFLCVVIFISYYASVTLFSHTHIISGATIAHSHLHHDSHHDTKSGGHTAQSITLIAQISHFEYTDFSCNYVPVPAQFQIHEDKIVEINFHITSIHLENLSLRAPPIV